MERLQDKKEYLELLKSSLLKTSEEQKRWQKISKAKSFCYYLEEHGVKYDLCIKHKEVLGCDESSKYYQRFASYLQSDYIICKNLLVRERKGEKRTFLVITDSRKQLDLGALKETLECKKLEFVKAEEMKELINTTPGNVSIFNMMYDKNHQVHLIIDENLLDADELAFHPLYNGMSIFLEPKECLKFIKLINRNAQFVPMATREEKGFEKCLAVS